mmetsp:Transcript_1899/g.4300  ORF Transcript_1899/g.4300 Transcript_1899/m.4300 type:complete len:216 (+) Transcript_1899:1849-2496(+)
MQDGCANLRREATFQACNSTPPCLRMFVRHVLASNAQDWPTGTAPAARAGTTAPALRPRLHLAASPSSKRPDWPVPARCSRCPCWRWKRTGWRLRATRCCRCPEEPEAMQNCPTAPQLPCALPGTSIYRLRTPEPPTRTAETCHTSTIFVIARRPQRYPAVGRSPAQSTSVNAWLSTPTLGYLPRNREGLPLTTDCSEAWKRLPSTLLRSTPRAA